MSRDGYVNPSSIYVNFNLATFCGQKDIPSYQSFKKQGTHSILPSSCTFAFSDMKWRSSVGGIAAVANCWIYPFCFAPITVGLVDWGK